MNTNDKLSPELEERIEEVLLDNKGKPENKKVSNKETCEATIRINPDKNTLDRG